MPDEKAGIGSLPMPTVDGVNKIYKGMAGIRRRQEVPASSLRQYCGGVDAELDGAGLENRPFPSKVLAMIKPFILTAFLFGGGLAPQIATGQASITTRSGSEMVTITEPGKIKLADLFKMADVVAVVHVVSGDEESYEAAIYKAVVVKNIKGTKDGAIIYFGKFTGGKLGSEYTLFLQDRKHLAVPKSAALPAYGQVNYLDVFNQGYSSMEGSYECLFDGNIPEQSCDYGVRVCTDYIVLPKGVHAFPPDKNDPPFGCRWVRKSKFMSLLNDMAERPGVLQLP